MAYDFGQCLCADSLAQHIVAGAGAGLLHPDEVDAGNQLITATLVGRAVGSVEFQADAAGIRVFVKAIIFSAGRKIFLGDNKALQDVIAAVQQLYR